MLYTVCVVYIENTIYIRGEFTRKKCKTAILLYCFHTQVYFTYLCYITFWALEYHFIENLKLMLKENQQFKKFEIEMNSLGNKLY